MSVLDNSLMLNIRLTQKLLWHLYKWWTIHNGFHIIFFGTIECRGVLGLFSSLMNKINWFIKWYNISQQEQGVRYWGGYMSPTCNPDQLHFNLFTCLATMLYFIWILSQESWFQDVWKPFWWREHPTEMDLDINKQFCFHNADSEISMDLGV